MADIVCCVQSLIANQELFELHSTRLKCDQGIIAGNFVQGNSQLSAVYLQRISHVTHGRMNPNNDI